jgi:hypothetical protein
MLYCKNKPLAVALELELLRSAGPDIVHLVFYYLVDGT